PVEIFRNDYKPLAHVVSKVSLDFSLYDGKTIVETVMTVEANKNVADNSNNARLVLNGDETCVKLLKLSVDGIADTLKPDVDYILSPGKLVISADALRRGGGVVRTTVEIVPEDNTQLSGLYKSGPMYCSQCEAEGFRRITYYPDRPDVMATFESVRIEADAENFPVLLSNGNLVEEGECSNDSEGRKRKFAVWSDPFPKPSYLFALVAGDLGCMEDSFTTMSGRNVTLRFYSEHKNVSKMGYAVESLKRAMKWDEDTFGLEYDLDLFNVVAVESFNMGAMENKSLNVFNTSCVLADPVTSSDANFQRIEGIIAHEYFHNWTGNRVTCRDWFQLTLKEGLTVFRDQQFSGQVNNSTAVNRIGVVQFVRGRQFAEDDGPMSHPIRPDSYIAMDNFYTATVYRKGSEIIRMYDTILSSTGFRKGMDLYFKRHDGCAVTCDDFLAAMADANGVDLSQFSRWYSTSGTPTVTYESSYDAKKGLFHLTLTQSSRSNDPLFIPVAVGLLDRESGEEVVPTTVLELKETSQTFDFPGLKGDVVPSILRNFSAPVKLEPASGQVNESDLAFLAAKDTDGVNRWDSAQRLYAALILKILNNESFDESMNRVLDTFGETLKDEGISDDSMRAFALILPGESTLAEAVKVVDPPAIRNARKQVKKAIAIKFKGEITAYYNKLTADIASDGTTFKVDGASVGRRRLRNVYLGYLCSINETAEEQKVAAYLASSHFNAATGMTDKLAAFNQLVSMSGEGASARDAAIQKFYDDADGDPLVLDKWFACQAGADLPDLLERVVKLTEHRDFTLKTPNRCRSVIMTYTMNEAAFHAEDGKGYQFLGDILEQLDKVNSKVAARTTASSLISWKRYNDKRAGLMKAQLERLKSMVPVSNDLLEIVSKGL
ncbi:membrane alanine aminopeptidase, partial [Thalassiosira pseudonana CCMP1335]